MREGFHLVPAQTPDGHGLTLLPAIAGILCHEPWKRRQLTPVKNCHLRSIPDCDAKKKQALSLFKAAAHRTVSGKAGHTFLLYLAVILLPIPFPLGLENCSERPRRVSGNGICYLMQFPVAFEEQEGEASLLFCVWGNANREGEWVTINHTASKCRHLPSWPLFSLVSHCPLASLLKIKALVTACIAALWKLWTRQKEVSLGLPPGVRVLSKKPMWCFISGELLSGN